MPMTRTPKRLIKAEFSSSSARRTRLSLANVFKSPACGFFIRGEDMKIAKVLFWLYMALIAAKLVGVVTLAWWIILLPVKY